MAYEVRIRFQGRVSCVTVEAVCASHAKSLVAAQYGADVVVLSARAV